MVMPSKQISNVHSGRPSAMLGTDEYAYAFDNIGNRMISAENGTDRNYAANQLNQYTEISNPTFNPSYDDDGNMLAAHGWTLTWDAENRLVSAANGNDRLEFVYDAYSRRREKKVYAGDVLTKHEKYLYNGYKMIAVFDALNEDARIMTFLWQPLELDIPLCMTYNNETYYYLADGNKNITGLFDATGNRVATYTYAPFGELLSASGTMASVNPFRFSSEQYDVETSLVYYNYRYYSPVLGRWLSRDPVEEKGGWNLYEIIVNNATYHIDVLGLSLCFPSTKPMSEQKARTGICVLEKLGYEKTTQIKFLKDWVDDAGIFEGEPISDYFFGEYNHYIFGFFHDFPDYIIINSSLSPNDDNGYFYSTLYHEATHGTLYFSGQGFGAIDDYITQKTKKAEAEIDAAIDKAKAQIVENRGCCKDGKKFTLRIRLYDKIICDCGGSCLSCDNPHRE